MQFDLIMADAFFSFADPKMAAGAIYGCLWLMLAATVLVLRSRRTRFPNFISLSICLFIGLFTVVHFAVMGLINMSLPPNISLGLLSGPPLWLSAAGIIVGLLAGWAISRLKPKTEGPPAGWGSLPTALVLSSFFPGMGQIYYGHYIVGVLAFIGVCLFSGLFRIWGFIVVYLLIQTATVANKAVGRFIDLMKTETRPRKLE